MTTMLDKLFRLSENRTTVRTEIFAGLATFLTMAYIIVVQPAVLSGAMFGMKTGLDFGAVTTATCLSAALAKHTGQPLDRIERDVERDFIMNAQRAKEYGIIDEIIDRPRT